MLIIDFIWFVGSKKNRVALKRTVCLKAWLNSATRCPRLSCLEVFLNRLFFIFCFFFFIVVPNQIIFSSMESTVDATGLERSRYQIKWDLSPCLIAPSQYGIVCTKLQQQYKYLLQGLWKVIIWDVLNKHGWLCHICLLYTSPSPRDA